MRIMLDTNVLISAFVFGGKVREVLIRLFETDCEIYPKMARIPRLRVQTSQESPAWRE